MFTRLIIKIIEGYQRYLSFDHSKYLKNKNIKFCIFEPSCSEYSKLSIMKFGILKGGLLGLARIIRCNPFNIPGIDNVKEKFILKTIFSRNNE